MIKKLFFMSFVAVMVTAQTQVDYPRQVKNGPIMADTLAGSSFASNCAAAVSAGASLSLTKAWLAVNTMTCGANLVFNGGSIQPASGQTVTLSVCPQNGPVPIFDISLGGAVSPLKCQQYFPEWWGALHNGSHDDTAAILAASAAAQAVGGTLSLPSCGTYLFSSTISIPSRMTIAGQGSGDSGSGAPCTVLTKTADVIGIYVQSGADYTTIKDLDLSSTVGSGSADGIVVGGVDATNGAGEVVIQNVVVSGQKGNGINVRNGNSGVIDHVQTSANGANGILISSQATSGLENTNAWRVYSSTALSNGQDGHNFNIAAAIVDVGFDLEGNGRYGLYSNRPDNFFVGHTEANTTDNVFEDNAMFASFGAISNPQNTWGGPSVANNAICNQGGTILCPSIVPTTMREVPHAAVGSVVVAAPYASSSLGGTLTINSDTGNFFVGSISDSNPFTVLSPSNLNFSQPITITIKNTGTAPLGAITWSGYTLNNAWTSPLPNFSRSITFASDGTGAAPTEVSRTPADVGSGSTGADFVYSSAANNAVMTGLTSSGSTTAFSYPNIARAAAYRTACQAKVSGISSTASAVQLNIELSGGATVLAAPSVNLQTSTAAAIIDAIETVPANTSGAASLAQWIVSGTNTGGTFAVNCWIESLQTGR